MQFVVPWHNVEFEIPDSWWRKSGMLGFKLAAQNFNFVDEPDHSIELAELCEVKPPSRNPGVAWFDMERMISVLEGISAHSPIPAVSVHAPPSATPKFEVRDGFHRYYASVAAGYSKIPINVLPYWQFKTL